jgi:hypothetical protein
MTPIKTLSFRTRREKTETEREIERERDLAASRRFTVSFPPLFLSKEVDEM